MRLFRVLTLNYYDDHFGFSTEELAVEDRQTVLDIFRLLGIGTNTKTQHGSVINLFGITQKKIGEARLCVLKTRRAA